MKQKSQIPKLYDERLVEALSHPIRAHALTVCTERPASATEIARELGEEVSGVDYHLKKLLALECIEEVETKKRRGATERFYRATVQHYFGDEAWQRVPGDGRRKVSIGVIRLISGDVSEAIVSRTVEATDRHLTRRRANFDRIGFNKVHEILDEALDQVLQVQEESVKRLARAGRTRFTPRFR